MRVGGWVRVGGVHARASAQREKPSQGQGREEREGAREGREGEGGRARTRHARLRVTNPLVF